MNLNLSSIFNVSILKDFSNSNGQEINIDKLIKIMLLISFFTLALVSGSFAEYILVTIVFFIVLWIYDFYVDITSVDLHFSSDDIQLNEIVNELWN